MWDRQRPSADFFEAYLGGLIRDGGSDVARTWIRGVYSEEVFHTLKDEVEAEREAEHSRLTRVTEPSRKRARTES